MIDLRHGEALELMKDIPDKSVDMILTDLPYGTTACKWDSVIPFEPMWEQLNRIIKDNGAIVLFGSQPFTSKLIMSNTSMYKYNWVWQKDNASNFLNKKYQPGRITEDICVFGKMGASYSKNGYMNYFPILEEGIPYECKGDVDRRTNAVISGRLRSVVTKNNGTRLPNNILKFNRDKNKVHPTQKPVKLLEYLIMTYTKDGGTVLDFTMGSGSTGVACVNTGRNFIGIELDDHYFQVAKDRINDAMPLFSEVAS